MIRSARNPAAHSNVKGCGSSAAVTAWLAVTTAPPGGLYSRGSASKGTKPRQSCSVLHPGRGTVPGRVGTDPVRVPASTGVPGSASAPAPGSDRIGIRPGTTNPMLPSTSAYEMFCGGEWNFSRFATKLAQSDACGKPRPASTVRSSSRRVVHARARTNPGRAARAASGGGVVEHRAVPGLAETRTTTSSPSFTLITSWCTSNRR